MQVLGKMDDGGTARFTTGILVTRTIRVDVDCSRVQHCNAHLKVTRDTGSLALADWKQR